MTSGALVALVVGILVLLRGAWISLSGKDKGLVLSNSHVVYRDRVVERVERVVVEPAKPVEDYQTKYMTQLVIDKIMRGER